MGIAFYGDRVIGRRKGNLLDLVGQVVEHEHFIKLLIILWVLASEKIDFPICLTQYWDHWIPRPKAILVFYRQWLRFEFKTSTNKWDGDLPKIIELAFSASSCCNNELVQKLLRFEIIKTGATSALNLNLIYHFFFN